MNPENFPAFLQAIGVVAVYALIKDVIPRFFGKNGKSLNGSGNGKGKDAHMTIRQHDRECELKLTPIKQKLDEVHKDLKAYMRQQGYRPSSEGE